MISFLVDIFVAKTTSQRSWNEKFYLVYSALLGLITLQSKATPVVTWTDSTIMSLFHSNILGSKNSLR